MNTYELNYTEIEKIIGETGYSLKRRKNTYVTPLPTRKPERANFEAGFAPVVAAILRVISNESKYYKRNEKAVEYIIDNGKFDKEHSKNAFMNYLENELKEIENGNVYKFEQLKYIPFTETSKEEKGELMYFQFFYDLFIREQLEEIQEIFSTLESQDLLSTIMSLSMIDKEDFEDAAQYKQLFSSLQKQFVEDLRILATNPTFLISNLEEFFVQYCYFALSQMIVQTNRITEFNEVDPIRIVMFLNTESAQKWREGYRYGYKLLKEEFRYFYAHEHVLNILGANTFSTSNNWFYHDYKNFFIEKGPEEERMFIQSIYRWIREVMCERNEDLKQIAYEKQTLDEAFRDLIELVRVKVQEEIYSRYTKSFDTFLRRFYRKNGGSLGSLLAISPKQLLTMIAVCVGPKNNRLELNQLWSALEKRGMFFDDRTKEEVVHLLDQLNYLIKKATVGMRNMLKQFYNIISNQFVTFFNEEAKNGEVNRYYLSLPNEEYIERIMTAVNELPQAEPFVFQIEEEESYETTALRFGDYKYVFATTLNQTHLDFIVNLRNEMSEQQGIWKNTSIIMISDKMLDSIRGGGRNLTTEGLPLNASQIVGNIHKLVEESAISNENKAILKHYLQSREELHNVENSSFLDFEDVLGWIYSESLDFEELKTLGYYPDKELEQFVVAVNLEVEGSAKFKKAEKVLKQRLDHNAETFEEHTRIRELGNAEERFVENYDEFGKTIYKDEQKIDFSKIIAEEDKVKHKKAISFLEDAIQVEVATIDKKKKITDYWKTKQSKRSYDLVIFHPYTSEEEVVLIKLPFTTFLTQENINGKHKNKVVKSGKSLVVTLPLKGNSNDFTSFSYRHENMSSSNFIFKIVIIRDEKEFYKNLETAYKLTVDGRFTVKLNDKNVFKLGDGSIEHELTTANETLEADGPGYTLSFLPSLLDEESSSFEFILARKEYEVKIKIDEDILRARPLTDIKIWERKMKYEASFSYFEDGANIVLNQHPYSTLERQRVFFRWEASWLEHNLRAAKIMNGQLVEKTLELSNDMQQAYEQFLAALKTTKSIPSLIYYSEPIRKAAENYIQTFNQEIESISNNVLLTAEQRELLYLGTLEKDFSLYMTPFSPLNVAYQLQLVTELNAESIDSNVLKQLNAAYIIPYLVNSNNEIYKPDSNDSLVEWHEYRPQEQVSIGETNNFLAKVINEKMTQFVNYYDYLFSISPQPTLIINVINIKNDSEVLKGILRWFKTDIQRKGSFTKLLTVDINFYTDDLDRMSSFELFNSLELPKQVKEIFGVDLNTKQLDDFDTLIEIQKRLRFSKHSMNDEIKYSHINFYKMNSNESIAKQIVTDAPNSTSLGGLYVSASSHETENGGYRLGFGLGDSDYTRTPLLRFSKNINELSANRTNYGNDPYNKENVISLHITTDDEERLNELYSSCTWLTFIDPSVDLEYFEKSSSELVIVHYSDQLSSSNHYDAITVTDKSPQYFRVIEEFLALHEVKVEKEMMYSIIRSFNTFNGEWLLRAVQNRGHDQREKMSIVAAIKHVLLNFEKQNIRWVPISLEEIVRVTGNVGLKKADGLFSGKTIGRTGNCSDDLLLIGVEETVTVPKVYMLPVEVKIGQNATNVIDKGISQVKELNARLNEYLKNDSFDAKFLRNFFMRMYIVNAHKMVLNNIWPEKDYLLTDRLKDQLLNDDFELSEDLRADFGDGAVMSFKKNLVEELTERKSGVMIYSIPEQIAYKSLGVTMEQLRTRDFSSVQKVENKRHNAIVEVEIDEYISDIDVDLADFTNDVSSNSEEVEIESRVSEKVTLAERPVEKILEEQEQFQQEATSSNIENQKQVNTHVLEEEISTECVEELMNSETKEVEEVRPLLGITKENKGIYWEYGNQKLANRHLVIGGRSGQGKTYFIQSVLRQLAVQKQSALIIDYSSSYTNLQLDDAFLLTVGDNFKERIVYFDGFPINPFLRRNKIIGGIVNKEPATETASRIKEVFTSVYGFGPQQSNALYRAAKICIETYGEKSNLRLMMEILVESEDISKSLAETVANKLVLFVDIDPFSYDEEFTWDDYFDAEGQISVIQFEGFEQDSIKKAMTEFILWDLWYFSQSNTAGRPLPVILDEAQNLNFKAGSPSDKILREGRKFGMSVWFATQTFTNFSKEELVVLENAATSIFFKPSESELNLVADKLNMKKNSEPLRLLKKGECIVQGQFVTQDELEPQRTEIIKVPAMK